MKNDIKALLESSGPLPVDQLADQLGVLKAKNFTELIKLISKMESRRELVFTRDGRVGLPPKEKKAPTVTGIFRAHKNGFGFVTVDEEEDDLFVGRNDVNHAIEGDKVEVIIKKVADRMKGTAAEAKVIDILEHALTSAVGLLILDEEKPKYAGYIKSKNQKISQRIYVKKSPLVLDGTEIIKVDIEKYPAKSMIISWPA